jgi:hypothetical protein
VFSGEKKKKDKDKEGEGEGEDKAGGGGESQSKGRKQLDENDPAFWEGGPKKKTPAEEEYEVDQKRGCGCRLAGSSHSDLTAVLGVSLAAWALQSEGTFADITGRGRQANHPGGATLQISAMRLLSHRRTRLVRPGRSPASYYYQDSTGRMPADPGRGLRFGSQLPAVGLGGNVTGDVFDETRNAFSEYMLRRDEAQYGVGFRLEIVEPSRLHEHVSILD